MDMGLFRGIVTVLMLLAFIGVLVWSFSKNRTAEFDAMSRMPLDNGDEPSVELTDREQNS